MRSEFREMYEQPILDAVMPFTPPHLGSPAGWRADAGESSFIGRDLELIEARTYKTKLRPLPFRDLFPTNPTFSSQVFRLVFFCQTLP